MDESDHISDWKFAVQDAWPRSGRIQGQTISRTEFPRRYKRSPPYRQLTGRQVRARSLCCVFMWESESNLSALKPFAASLTRWKNSTSALSPQSLSVCVLKLPFSSDALHCVIDPLEEKRMCMPLVTRILSPLFSCCKSANLPKCKILRCEAVSRFSSSITVSLYALSFFKLEIRMIFVLQYCADLTRSVLFEHVQAVSTAQIMCGKYCRQAPFFFTSVIVVEAGKVQLQRCCWCCQTVLAMSMQGWTRKGYDRSGVLLKGRSIGCTAAARLFWFKDAQEWRRKGRCRGGAWQGGIDCVAAVTISNDESDWGRSGEREILMRMRGVKISFSVDFVIRVNLVLMMEQLYFSICAASAYMSCSFLKSLVFDTVLCRLLSVKQSCSVWFFVLYQRLSVELMYELAMVIFELWCSCMGLALSCNNISFRA